MSGKPSDNRALYVSDFGRVLVPLWPTRISLEKLTREIDVSYTHFHAVLKGMRAGKPAAPSTDLVVKTLDALGRLGVIVSPGEAAALMQTAARLPGGYSVVREDQPPMTGPELAELFPELVAETEGRYSVQIKLRGKFLDNLRQQYRLLELAQETEEAQDTEGVHQTQGKS